MRDYLLREHNIARFIKKDLVENPGNHKKLNCDKKKLKSNKMLFKKTFYMIQNQHF
jgi:hypothetical protein